LYERFCFEHGWIARADAKGNYKEWMNYPERVHDDHLGDMASWPQSSYPQIIFSWGSFWDIWKKHRNKIQIRPPGRDTCLQCNIFRNQHQYLGSENNDINLFESSDFNEVIVVVNSAEERDEQLIIAAAKRVKATVSQKILADQKIENARSSLNNNVPYNEKVVTLVMDYCQNLDLPHVGGEQVGEVYFYSPIGIYCLGIVDSGKEKLYAYVYS